MDKNVKETLLDNAIEDLTGMGIPSDWTEVESIRRTLVSIALVLRDVVANEVDSDNPT